MGRKSIPYYGSRNYLDLLEVNRKGTADRPSESRNPVKCHCCREWLTERGRQKAQCTECHSLHEE